MKIAIVGSGISGLYAAWQLSKQHQITVFEKNDYFGGHTDTHQLLIEGKDVNVDSGFIVFNEFNYPLFSAMLAALNVPIQNSDMSFSVNNLVSGLQYNPSKKWSLLSKPQNFLKSPFRKMLSDLLRFYADNKDEDVSECPVEITIDEYLDQHGYSQEFRLEHLYPMCGALWSSPVSQVGRIPYKFVVSFFQHHRMLALKNRPQWQTVKGGSATYVRAIQKHCPSIIWKPYAVEAVLRDADQVFIETVVGTEKFDWVIFASHADDTLTLLKDASTLEQKILGSFRYQNNRMVVHSDQSIMPKRRSQWASWHVHVTVDHVQLEMYHQTKRKPADLPVHYGFTYWMNNLQNLSCKPQVFSTLNPNFSIAAQHILVERHYRHPIFDQYALMAQPRWAEINGQNRSSFCGAYWGWGFHEDGAHSAARVVEQLAALSSSCPA